MIFTFFQTLGLVILCFFSSPEEKEFGYFEKVRKEGGRKGGRKGGEGRRRG